MEDILASIRRILSEDEPAATPADEAPASDDVIDLDSSMIVAEPPPEPEAAKPVEPPPSAPPVIMAAPQTPPPPPPPAMPSVDSLVAPATAAAVTSSVGGLLRTLMNERDQVQVYRGGPTLEDLVREEMRPLLKEWLDSNLQPLV